jgi:hypothetical protein
MFAEDEGSNFFCHNNSIYHKNTLKTANITWLQRSRPPLYSIKAMAPSSSTTLAVLSGTGRKVDARSPGGAQLPLFKRRAPV